MISYIYKKYRYKYKYIKNIKKIYKKYIRNVKNLCIPLHNL